MTDRVWIVMHGVSPSLWRARILTKRQTVGRSSDCDIRVVHSTVSRRHAELWREGNTVHVRDLDSSNGTFIDHQRVQQCNVEVGQTIQIGQVPLNVVSSINEDACGIDDETELQTDPSQALCDLLDSLSPGQEQVVNLLLRGLGEKEVAQRLCLSRHTVHTHVKHIYKLLGVQSRSQLMAKYLGHKAAPPQSRQR